MKMIEAIELIVKEHPNYTKQRIEDVLCAIIKFNSFPGASTITFFDPEKCPIEESYLFLKRNTDMLHLCEQKTGTKIPSEVMYQVFGH
jgi:hypothetical protein